MLAGLRNTLEQTSANNQNLMATGKVCQKQCEKDMLITKFNLKHHKDMMCTDNR